MREEAKENEAEDERKRAKIDAENSADAVLYQTKKVLEEFADKVDASTKTEIEGKMKALEEARKCGDAAEINRKIEELNKAVQVIGTKMYQDAAAKQAKPEAGSKNSGKKSGDDNVVDADFEEKKED